MKKLLTAALAAVMAVGALSAQGPKREYRSIWLTTYMTIDWPSERGSSASAQAKQKQELVDYIENHYNRNFNSVCFHVRTAADAVYESSYEPWSEYVSGTRGKSPGYDPLAFVVEECHKRGLSCYAWINPFRLRAYQSMSRTTEFDKSTMAKGWYIKNSAGYETFDPGLPECREHILKVIKEIYTKYRIDGFLFDDYFYPNAIPENNTAGDWDTYKKYNPDNLSMGDWRRENINSFMRELHHMIMEDRPDMTFGLSPAGIAHNGSNFPDLPPFVPGTTDWQYNDIYSDPVAWLKDQSIDFISPQLYWFTKPGLNSYTTAAPFQALTSWWSTVAQHYGRHVYMSLGPYRMIDGNNKPVYNNEAHWADLSDQISYVRQYNNNCGGQIYFSSKYMDGPLCSGWGDYLQEHSYQLKALTPLISWKERPNLTSPDAKINGTTISWTAADQTGNAPIMRYTVYAIPNTVPMERASGKDGISNKYLMDVVYGGSYAVSQDAVDNCWFAVCAYDNYGYESTPTVINYPEGPFPAVEITKEGTEYSPVGDFTMENVWYRSADSEFDGLEYTGATNGSMNRGMVISNGLVLVTGRTENSITGAPYIKKFDLKTGEFLEDVLIDIPADNSYRCNDIIRDSNGDVYISNLTLNANTNPLTLYRYDSKTDEVSLFAELKSTGLSNARIDHCAIEVDKTTEGQYYVYAVVANGNTILRWTVKDNVQTAFASRTVGQYYPASSPNFGTAPKCFVVEHDILVVDGGTTHPTEYNFANGQIVSSLASNTHLVPEGAQANGFVHFGQNECLMAYVGSDHNSAQGYKFHVVSGDKHGFANTLNKVYTLPQIEMGKLTSTTMSTPIDAMVVEEDGKSVAYLAVYAPGNALAVYRMTGSKIGKPASKIEIEDGDVSFIVSNGAVLFSDKVDAEIYTVTGQLVASVKNASILRHNLSLGVYILKFGDKAERVLIK